MAASDNSGHSDFVFQKILSNVPYVLGSRPSSYAMAIGRKRPTADQASGHFGPRSPTPQGSVTLNSIAANCSGDLFIRSLSGHGQGSGFDQGSITGRIKHKLVISKIAQCQRHDRKDHRVEFLAGRHIKLLRYLSVLWKRAGFTAVPNLGKITVKMVERA